jgi:hypothetical protein
MSVASKHSTDTKERRKAGAVLMAYDLAAAAVVGTAAQDSSGDMRHTVMTHEHGTRSLLEQDLRAG